MRGLAVLLAAAFVACGGDAIHERRRVLLITVDTLRADHVGRTDLPLPLTPFVDGLTAAGTRFTRAVAPVPRTTQSLASLMTGAYPHTTGVVTLYDPLRPGIRTLAERLREAGFATIAVVSNHMLPEERELDRGFDVYDFAGDHRDAAATTAAALVRMKGIEPDARVFLWVHYIDPHVPYHPPPELARALDPGYEGPYELFFGSEPGGLGNRAYPEDLPKWRAVYRNDLPDRVNEHVRRLYAADVRYTDDQIARLVSGLRQRVGDDWLVVFTSDHGESLGEHEYFFDHGDYVYEPGLRIPLAFAFAPGDPLRGGRDVTDRVSLVDVAPTLAALLELPEDPAWQRQVEGRSLLPLLRGESLEPVPLLAESGMSFFPEYVKRRVGMGRAGRFRALTVGDEKLIVTPGAKPDARFELYDLAEDPDELHDLAPKRSVRVAALAEQLARWTQHDAETREEHEPSAEDRERLRSLGYVED